MSDAIRVVGMMSGTSMDGIDVAEVVTDGITVQEFGKTAYVPYSEDERQILRRAMGQWDGLHACGCKIGDALARPCLCSLGCGSGCFDRLSWSDIGA